MARAILRRTGHSPEPLLDQARRWAEEGDPEKTVRELFGYRVYADARKALYELDDSGALITWGGHSLAKTFLVGAGMVGHYWYAGGSVLADDGRPRGALLALMAGKLSQIQRTSWEAIRRHLEAARKNGHPILGSVLPVDVGLRADDADPLRWSIISQPFRQPAKASGARAIQTEAGLKHPHAIHVWMEEFDTLPAAMEETVRGWSEPGKRFGAFNPAHQGAGITARLKSREWSAVNFSILRWEPLLERRPIPGGASHVVFEEEMRDPTRCRPLDVEKLREDGKEPSAEAGHFRYALPDRDEPEAEGPRPDGIPGHPAAVPRWWKAGDNMIWQRLGLFPTASDLLLFPPSLLSQCHGLWRSLAEPTWAPRTVGVDTAEGGPDRFTEVGQFGRGAVELWNRYQSALSRKLEAGAAVEYAMRCGSCEGNGCGQCWGGAAPCYVGRPRSIVKTNDPAAMARRVIERYSTEPAYSLDAGGGGFYIVKPLQDLGARAAGVHFGGDAAQIEGQRGFIDGAGGGYLNQRARMFGVLSYAAMIGALALPPPELGPLEEELSDGMGIPEWERAERKAGVYWKLPDKGEISSALSVGSPDPMDAAALTQGESAAPSVGGSDYISL